MQAQPEAARPRSFQRQTLQWAYYGLPMLFCLALYWRGLKGWFFADDFAWLGLRLQVHSFPDLLPALFAPQAQGTVRTLSERAYFMTLSSVFGLHALPFRICAFLTQFANLALLASITRRITGSAMAGFLAPVFWTANAAMVVAMSWSSTYNEILCGFFLLAAFWFLLRHIEGNSRRDAAGMWICFLLGFGALELIVVFPALAAAYCLCRARAYLPKTLPLFAPPILFSFIHWEFIPKTSNAIYHLYFDPVLFTTLRDYWLLALAACRPDIYTGAALQSRFAIGGVLTAVLLGFAVWKLWRGDTRGVFFVAWFLIVLAPVLPLKNHFQDYYLTLPAAGLAMLGAWGTASALKGHRASIVTFVSVCVCAYLFVSIYDLKISLRWYYNRGLRMERMMHRLDAAYKKHPEPIVFLTGVSDQLFWSGFEDNPFRLLGIRHVYLAPGTERAIAAHPEWGGISDFIAPASFAANALKQNQAAVFSVVPNGPLDVTSEYQAIFAAQATAVSRYTVDVGDPLFADRLGPEWYGAADGTRWMPQQATLEIGGPQTANEKLYVTGYLPAALVSSGPLHLTVSADGTKLGTVALDRADRSFMVTFPLPAALVGKYQIQLTVSVDRVTHVPPDTRALGLMLVRFQIQ